MATSVSYTFDAAPGETVHPADPPRTKPHVSYGLPFATACAHHAANTFHASRIYVVISGSISKTHDWKKLQTALSAQAEIVGVTAGGIDPHTPWHQVYALTNELRATQPDLVLAVGGGSITDGVKLARLFAANGVVDDAARVALWEKLKPDFARERTGQTDPTEDGSVKPAAIPVINVVTTLSGGEWTHYGGATDAADHKSLFGHSSMLTDLVIYDAALTLPVPERFWISTGMRAVDHFVEGLAGVAQPPAGWDPEAVRDQFEDSLRKLLPGLLTTKKDPAGLDARLCCMLATVPVPKIIPMGIGASHGIGHQLGPLGVGHGETSCILSPSVLKYNRAHGDALVRRRQERIRSIFWSEPAVVEVLRARGLEEDAADAGDALDAYVRELGMPRNLKGMGIEKRQFEALAESSLKDICTQNSPVKLDKNDVMEILEMAFES